METKEKGPKSILILDDIKTRSVKWEKEYDPDGDFQVISLEELNNLPYKFDSGRPKIGQIYIQHPFKSEIYLNPSINPGEIETIKLRQLAQLSAILGAKHFKTKLINREVLEKSRSGESDFSNIVNEVKVGAQNNLGQVISDSFELDIEFDGFVPQYQEAHDYAIQSGLSKDKKIWEFIQTRNPSHNNLARKYTERINLSEEINKNLEIGASLKAFAGQLNIGAKYSSTKKEIKIVELEIYVEF
jgi:hypothetical protein